MARNVSACLVFPWDRSRMHGTVPNEFVQRFVCIFSYYLCAFITSLFMYVNTLIVESLGLAVFPGTVLSKLFFDSVSFMHYLPSHPYVLRTSRVLPVCVIWIAHRLCYSYLQNFRLVFHVSFVSVPNMFLQRANYSLVKVHYPLAKTSKVCALLLSLYTGVFHYLANLSLSPLLLGVQVPCRACGGTVARLFPSF